MPFIVVGLATTDFVHGFFVTANGLTTTFVGTGSFATTFIIFYHFFYVCFMCPSSTHINTSRHWTNRS